MIFRGNLVFSKKLCFSATFGILSIALSCSYMTKLRRKAARHLIWLAQPTTPYRRRSPSPHIAGAACHPIWWAQPATPYGGRSPPPHVAGPACHLIWWVLPAIRVGRSPPPHMVGVACHLIW